MLYRAPLPAMSVLMRIRTSKDLKWRKKCLHVQNSSQRTAIQRPRVSLDLDRTQMYLRGIEPPVPERVSPRVTAATSPFCTQFDQVTLSVQKHPTPAVDCALTAAQCAQGLTSVENELQALLGKDTLKWLSMPPLPNLQTFGLVMLGITLLPRYVSCWLPYFWRCK